MNQRRIDPTLYIAAADEFRAISESAANRLSDARSSLGQYARMAGDDPGGEQLAQGYDDMARDALQALSDIAVLANTMDRAIMQSGWNHAAAEEAAGGKPAGGAFTVRPARTPVTVGAPPSAFGGSDDTPEAWDVVKDFVGMMWPNADVAKLRSAGTTWDGVEKDVRALATEIRQADNALMGLNSAELAKLRSEVGDFATDVSAAAGDISEVGDLCREYATDVEEAHREVIQMLVQLAIEIAATVAIGAALSVFTFGASAVVAGGGLTARIILVAQRIVTFLTKVSGTAARIVARLAAISARVVPLANRFQRTARIVVSVTSGTLAAGSSELLVKGRDGNLLVAMGSGLVGGAVTDTVALAFGKYGQRVAVQALANGAGGASSGASNGLLNGDGVDIRQVLISGVGGTVMGAGMSIRGRRGGTSNAADPGSGNVHTPDVDGPRVGGSDGPSTGDGSGIGRQPDYDGPQVTGGNDSGGSGAGDGGSGTRPDYDGPQVTGGNDAGGSGGDGGGIRIPDGEAPQAPSIDVTPPTGDGPTVTVDAPHVPTGGADAPTGGVDAPHVPTGGTDAPTGGADAPAGADSPTAPHTTADAPTTSDDISRQFDDLEADINRQFDDLEADIDRQFDELEADINRQFDDVAQGHTDTPPADAPVDPADAPVDPADAPVDGADGPFDGADAPRDATDPADPGAGADGGQGGSSDAGAADGSTPPGGEHSWVHHPASLAPIRPELASILDGDAASGNGWHRVVDADRVESVPYPGPRPEPGLLDGRFAPVVDVNGHAVDVGDAARLLDADPTAPYGHRPDGTPYTDGADWSRDNVDRVLGSTYGNMHWAPNDGAVFGTRVRITDLQTFDRVAGNLHIDRLGRLSGSYMGLGGGTFAERGLPPNQVGQNEFWHVSLRPGAQLPAGWSIEVSRIAPAYGQPGGGLQIVVRDANGEGVKLDELGRLFDTKAHAFG
ncbi:glycohydrolase toxin TNT-related protein [Microbacterium ureisolvens]|uniref:WXG100-like domain-containing protein n=1 Tax=Microbacterium ureisolvens TaxID=2781186 RepID=UPI003625FFC7